MSSIGADIATLEAIANENAAWNWYALADSAQHSALPGVLNGSNNQTRCLFGAPEDSPVGKLSPHLVQLQRPMATSPEWSWIRRNADLKPCVTIIASSLSFDVLFHQLAACVEIKLPDGEAMYFSFWDSAVLGALVGQPDDVSLHVPGPVLDVAQMKSLLHCIEGWWYWNRDGKFCAINTVLDDTLPAPIPLLLSQLQVDALVELSVPDHVLYYVTLNQEHLIEDVPVRQRYALVRSLLVDARELGLEGMGDMVNYVCTALIYGARFQTDPEIRAVLNSVKNGAMDFGQALEHFP